MSVIWKYELFNQHTELSVPEGATIVSFGKQAEYPCLWMRVPDPHAVQVRRWFVLVPTGQDITDGSRFLYVGTIIMGEPSHLVWHVFEDRAGQQDTKP